VYDQLQTPPNGFGMTSLRFDPPGERFPHLEITAPWRHGDVITFPYDARELEFYSLRGGAQFLSRPIGGGAVWFGGTDERSFLVEIQPELLPTLLWQGEGGFYEALKPPIIRQLEALFGDDRTVRQGDVYAYQLPASWGELQPSSEVGRRRNAPIRIMRTRVPMPVLATRHRVSGRVAPSFKGRVTLPLDADALRLTGLIAQGVLTAPDHAPLTLEDGPNLLAVSKAVVSRRLVGTPYRNRWLGD
jgi:hypothetical protein